MPNEERLLLTKIRAWVLNERSVKMAVSLPAVVGRATGDIIIWGKAVDKYFWLKHYKLWFSTGQKHYMLYILVLSYAEY